MRNSNKILIFIMVMCLTLGSTIFAEVGDLGMIEPSEVESIVEKYMDEGKIPGASVVIVKEGEVVYEKGFGYSDVKGEVPVTEGTYFELGSNSKAFTALGILNLEKEGLVDREGKISEYIPWFKTNYEGQRANITVEQVLNHTSGIPFSTIEGIPQGTSDDMLEKTVRTLVGCNLASEPGENFQYATINYDILGLIIQNVSGMSYEAYIQKSILEPMGLENTYMFKEEVPEGYMSKGYKIGFVNAKEFNAPEFRGNKPAGYIVSNLKDVGVWLKAQLGHNQGFDLSLIEESHRLKGSAQVNSLSRYTTGWFVNETDGYIYHGGNNPNYSSYMVIDSENNTAVAVLTNLNSAYTTRIGDEIMTSMRGETLSGTASDQYQSFGKIALAAVIIGLLVTVVLLGLTGHLIFQIIKKERTFTSLTRRRGIKGLIALIFIGLGGAGLIKIPELLFKGLSWESLRLWGPKSISTALIVLAMAGIMIIIYIGLEMFFKKANGRSYFTIVVLSMVSGMGNAMVIFMINQALARPLGFHLDLFLYFLIGIFTYVFGQRVVRSRLIKITNDMVFELRMKIVDKVLNTSFENIEKLENGRIQAILNNDTETVSNVANQIITLITNVITLICCFTYLGIINGYALLLSVGIIGIIASIYFFAVQKANRLWEQTRDTQNVFFGFINDITQGFKELRLNIFRRKEFKEDMRGVSCDYSQKRGKATLTFANVFVIGELVFTLAIGVIVFIFPVMLKGLQSMQLNSYVFILLYMTGPVNGLLALIPNLVGIRVSWNRVKRFMKEATDLEDKGELVLVENKDKAKKEKIELKLENIEYEYGGEEHEKFKVGPINYSFKSGEIVFVTGGNGSGKSTLAKIVTGLYSPHGGNIKLNGKGISSQTLEQKYSAIFGDFYIFQKLYGINYKEKLNDIEKYLNTLRINDKLEVVDGKFSTTRLSSGQRKRLALTVSYLEDRPIYLFDEWAADQDPEFREFFYKELLPELKNRGKCIIAITHDDKYYDMADKIIKMEFGQISDRAKQF